MRRVKFKAIYNQPLEVGGTYPVIVEGGGIFHQWGQECQEFEAGPGNRTVGLVECTGMPLAEAGHLTVGKIYKVDPSDIVFMEPFKA